MPIPETVHNGVPRKLGWKPTPRSHPLFGAAPSWESTGLATLDPKSIAPFKDRVRAEVPILDQQQTGECVAHAYAAAMMIQRAEFGMPFVKLCPSFLYTLINGGVDNGANASDAVSALKTVGICPFGMVPLGVMGPPGYNAAAKAAAARFKLRDAVQIQGFAQAVSAVYYGYSVCFDVEAGDGFDVDENGVCSYLGANTNHEVYAGEEWDGTHLGGRNSWGTSWGVGGKCFWQARHLDNSQETYAVRFVADDPQDPIFA